MNSSFRIAFWTMCCGTLIPLTVWGVAECLTRESGRAVALGMRNPHWGLHRTPAEHPAKASAHEGVPLLVAELGPAAPPEEADRLEIAAAELPAPAPRRKTDLQPTPVPVPVRSSRQPPVRFTGRQRAKAPAVPVTLDAPTDGEERSPGASADDTERQIEFQADTQTLEAASAIEGRFETRLASLQQHLDRLTQLQIAQVQQQRQLEQVQRAGQLASQVQQQTTLQTLEKQVQTLRDELDKTRQTSDRTATVMSQLAAAAHADAEAAGLGVARSEETVPAAATPLATRKVPVVLHGIARPDGLVSLECRNCELAAALSLLGKLAGKNLVVSQQLTGKASAHLQDVGFDAALELLATTNGGVVRRQGEVVTVLAQAEAAAQERISAQPAPLNRLYRPRHISARDLEPLVAALLTPQVGRLAVTRSSSVPAENAPANSGDELAQPDALLVVDVPQVHVEVEKLLAEMDVLPAQLQIEATLVSVKLHNPLQFGLDFTTLGEQAGQPMIQSQGEYEASRCLSAVRGEPGSAESYQCGLFQGEPRQLVRACAQQGETHLLANPRVLVLNKQQATLSIGGRHPFPAGKGGRRRGAAAVSFIETSTKLKLRPLIAADGLIRLEIVPERCAVVMDRGTQLPQVTTAGLATHVLVADGQTIVLGGLFEEQSVAQPARGRRAALWPWSQTDPSTVRQQARTELVVLITPRIIRDPHLVSLARHETSSPSPAAKNAENKTPAIARLPEEPAARFPVVQTLLPMTAPRTDSLPEITLEENAVEYEETIHAALPQPARTADTAAEPGLRIPEVSRAVPVRGQLAPSGSPEIRPAIVQSAGPNALIIPAQPAAGMTAPPQTVSRHNATQESVPRILAAPATSSPNATALMGEAGSGTVTFLPAAGEAEQAGEVSPMSYQTRSSPYSARRLDFSREELPLLDLP